ncbi:amino acid ABC transporter permease [Microvirga sp. WGZ8]|uniref:Amino acid ABC transporter permease n=1 Tax=Microvirga puerhi TaxID=2876078 RepID=A0ABS7VJL0_9HYPH|nr:amino acid ABC transporter permease [Microvirga puerhi]
MRLPRVKRTHYGRYLSGVVLIALFVLIVRAFAHGKIDWEIVGEFLTARSILSGLLQTIIMAPLAMGVGLALGLIFALMRMSENPVARYTAIFYMWIFRGSPQLLQLFLWFNLALIFPVIVIPGLFEISTVTVMTPFVATLLGLGICQSAYTAEVIRAGILSVDAGQAEAADALGMTRHQAMRRIILPQALRSIIPPVGNEFIGMVKATSLASAIQYTEILNAAQRIYYVNNYIIELLIVATFWYLLVVTLLTIGQYFLERRMSRGFSRTESVTSLNVEDQRA